MLHIIAVLVLTTASSTFAGVPKQKFAWSELSYAWPNDELLKTATASGMYVSENNLPLGVAVWKNKVFVTCPRWKWGVASGLNYINLDDNTHLEHNASLTPYPSWEDNYLQDPEKGLITNSTVVSVFRMWVDKCDRLWVMDTGVYDILNATIKVAPPSIVIFDLTTDKLIRRRPLGDKMMNSKSFFANVIVDVESGECNNAFAYLPDLGGYGVVVYDFNADKMWRVEHNYFYMDPLNGEFNSDGLNFQWVDGVFAFAISGKMPDGSRNLMFHSFASTKEFVVSNKLMKNETLATDKQNNYGLFQLLGDRGPNSQATASFYDEKTKVLFYTQVNKNAIACWNVQKPLIPSNTDIVYQSNTSLIFPNDLKVDADRNIWVLADRLPKFIYSNLDYTETNFRILTIPIDEAIKGTLCEA